MRLHRFYVNKPLGEELVVVEKNIVHQWNTVFRYGDGKKVILFSPQNKGFDYTYQILSIGKDQASLDFISKEANFVPKRDLTLCMALVKKDTFETVVRQATELGATAIVPILAGHSEKKNINMERLETIAIEAAEQCGRGDVPTIFPVEKFQAAFEKRGRDRNIFASLLGAPISDHAFTETEPLNVWIGPEGGWTDEEETIAKSGGAELLRLGDTVLRADTASVAILSLMR